MSYLIGRFFLWTLYLPVIIILSTLFYLVPKVRERFSFEKKNLSEAGAISFKADNLQADLCFEFSSEGEYQQVASLIDDSLKDGKKLELVFFSPSVEKTILELHRKFPSQIRYLRYSLLSLKFSSWISSKNLILVRYDLFPELLIWSLKKENILKFVWVSFKKERLSGKTISFIKKAFLKNSSVAIFSSDADAALGKKLGISGPVYDFRMEQIKRRMEKREEKFAEIFPLYSDFKSLLMSYPREKRLIIGNAWPEDIFLVKDAPSDVLIVVVPHQLKAEVINSIQDQLKSFGRRSELITDETKKVSSSQNFIINKKGILCELYQDFGKAYVGGGFGVSVHSLLEPLVAGSEHLSCGPVNYRSSEYDLALDLGHLKEVRNSQEFREWLAEDIVSSQDHDRLEAQLRAYPAHKKEILS